MASTAFSTVNILQLVEAEVKGNDVQLFILQCLWVGRDFRDSFFSIAGRCLSNFSVKISSDPASGHYLRRQPLHC